MAGEIQLNGTTALTESSGAITLNNVNSATNRTNLGLGTAATSAVGDFATSTNLSDHAAVTSGVHGISAYGATLVDDADAPTARTTLGLGTAATSASTAFASSSTTITAGTGLSGGGNLSTNRTINVSFSANESNVKTAINASGSAPIYACRAWINFNGSSASIGTGRANGNVSGVTDHGTGNYQVTFATAMPDANYCANVSAKQDESGAGTYVFGSFYAGSGATVANVFSNTSIRVTCNIGNGTPLYDAVVMCVSIYR